MNRTKRIKNILQKTFLNFSINVIDNSLSHKGHNNFNGDNETHILVELKKNSDFKIERLVIHKKINNLLQEEFKLGLHSLQIKIF